jgi:type II secretory pathway pseudopilin PulG
MSLLGLQLPAAIILGALTAAAYLIGYVRHRGLQFSLLDALLVVAIMVVGTAVAMPLLNAAHDRANSSALRQNLRAVREQIALYKIEHGGRPPLLFEGTFPQLEHATNSEGIPGPPGKAYPHGPYLPGGMPVNPYTGVSEVTATDTFPPAAPTGVGGWLYHQQTGRLAPDLEGHLHD